MSTAKHSEHIPYAVEGVYGDRYQMQPRTIARLLLEQVRADGLRPEDLTVLDFACGRGELLPMLHAAGFQARGVDMDPECVRLAARHGPCAQAGLDELAEPGGPLPPKSVDILVAAHILEHLPDPVAAIARFRSVARRYVFLAVPNLSSWWVFRNHLMRRQTFPPDGHLMGWDWSHLRILLERHGGLEIARQYGFQIALVPVAGLERRLPSPPLKAAARALDRALRPLHYAWLPRLFPRVAHQIMVVCRVPDATPARGDARR